MKIYLVIKYSPEIKFDEDSLVVALTPLVCYQLDKAGLKYSIIEDFYDEIELASHEDEYYKSQLNWFAGLDEFLQKNIKELKEANLNLATVYYLNLKGMVLDPVYIRCYTLRKLFEAVKPSSVTFVSAPPPKSSLGYDLKDNGWTYYSLIAPLICRQFNIPLESVFVTSDNNKTTTAASAASIAIRFKQALAKNGAARRLYFSGKYFRKRLTSGGKGEKQLNILMLTNAYLRDDFAIDALARGHRVYLLYDDAINKYTCFSVRRYLNLKPQNEAVTSNPDFEKAANLLNGDNLIRQFNEICQLDVSSIVLPKLKYFISVVCPIIFKYFKIFKEFYEKDGIDYVITPYEASLPHFAAVVAANCSKNTKAVNLEHGDTVYAANFWNVIWMSRFDIDIATNDEIIEYFRKQCRVNTYTTKLFSSPHRLLPIKQIYQTRQKSKTIKKNRIIYIPTMMRGNYGRFDGVHYPDTWYYKLQKELVAYLATRREYTFVWKGNPKSDSAYNPIPDYIKDNRFSNIEIAATPLLWHLPAADKAIHDYPSTAFYETIVAGVPTLSLYHRALKVRPSAIASFGKLLTPFSNTAEAIKHIEEFLSSSPGQYKYAFDLEGSSVIEILEEVSKQVFTEK